MRLLSTGTGWRRMGKCLGASVFFFFLKSIGWQKRNRGVEEKGTLCMCDMLCTCVYSRHTVFLHTYYELVIIDVRRRGKNVGEGDHHSEMFFSGKL